MEQRYAPIDTDRYKMNAKKIKKTPLFSNFSQQRSSLQPPLLLFERTHLIPFQVKERTRDLLSKVS